MLGPTTTRPGATPVGRLDGNGDRHGGVEVGLVADTTLPELQAHVVRLVELWLAAIAERVS